MIDHVTLKVRNLLKSKTFYEKSFLPLGYKVSFGEEGAYHAFDIGPGLFEISQHQGKNRLTTTHVAFRVRGKKDVQAFYRAALKAGGKDNGAPGPRPEYAKNYYACFVFDPDNNNIEVMCD